MKEMTKISGFSKKFTQNAFPITNICYLMLSNAMHYVLKFKKFSNNEGIFDYFVVSRHLKNNVKFQFE